MKYSRFSDLVTNLIASSRINRVRKYFGNTHRKTLFHLDEDIGFQRQHKCFEQDTPVQRDIVHIDRLGVVKRCCLTGDERTWQRSAQQEYLYLERARLPLRNSLKTMRLLVTGAIILLTGREDEVQVVHDADLLYSSS